MILSALDKIHPELRIWSIVAVETGMRRGEIYSLRKEWVRGRVAYLPDTKNGTARQVPLSSRARSLSDLELYDSFPSSKRLKNDCHALIRPFMERFSYLL